MLADIQERADNIRKAAERERARVAAATEKVVRDALRAAIAPDLNRLNTSHRRHVRRCGRYRLGRNVIDNCVRVERARYALRLADIERKHGVTLRRAGG